MVSSKCILWFNSSESNFVVSSRRSIKQINIILISISQATLKSIESRNLSPYYKLNFEKNLVLISLDKLMDNLPNLFFSQLHTCYNLIFTVIVFFKKYYKGTYQSKTYIII